MIRKIFFDQLRQIYIIIGIFFLVIFTFIVVTAIGYPGTEGIEKLLQTLDNPAFKFIIDFFFLDLFRFLNFDQYYFGLWLQVSLVSIIPIFFVALGLYLGVESITHDQATGTLDLIFSLPIPIRKYFIIRLLGSIIWIFIALIIGIFATYFAVLISGFEIVTDIETSIAQVWLIVLLQTLLGLFLGSFIGILYFNRGFGLQLSMVFIGGSYVLFLVLNTIENITFTGNLVFLQGFIEPLINILKLVSIFSYLQNIDLFIFKNFRFDAFIPLIFAIILLVVLTLYYVSRRDIIDTDLPSIHVYFAKKIVKNPEKEKYQKFFSPSKIFIFWIFRFKNKFPILVDELTAKATTFTLYCGLLLVSTFIQYILYPGDEAVQGIINAFQFSPFYILFARGYDLSQIPYLGYIIAQLFSFLPLIFLPYVIYSFIHAELRDYSKTEEMLLIYPISKRDIFIWRSVASIIEYYIIVIIISLTILVSEIYLMRLNYTLMEILVLILSGPLYLSIGFFCGLIIKFLGKKGAVLSILLVLLSLVLFFIGALNESWSFISQFTPYAYFDSVRILFYGFQWIDLLAIGGFSVIMVLLVFVRIKFDKGKTLNYLSIDPK